MLKQEEPLIGFKFGYARVSADDQNLGRQIETLRGLGVPEEHIYTEKEQGDKFGADRPQLEALIHYVRKGDQLYVASFDRLGRSHIDLLNLIERIKAKGVSIHFIEERINISPIIRDPYDELNANIFSAFADFFKKQLKIRQRQGIKLAKENGVYKGRKPKLEKDKKIEILRKVILEGYCASEIELEYKVSRTTIWRIIKRDESISDERNEIIKQKLKKDLKRITAEDKKHLEQLKSNI